MATAARDPFAPFGTVGNRGLQLGSDGPIPARYRNLMEKAIRLAYQLAGNAAFNAAFESTLRGLDVQDVPKDAYLTVLDKAIVHHAETAKAERVIAELKEDAIARAADRSYQSPRAFSVRGGRDMWLREALLSSQSPTLVAGALMHEAAHLAGAPGNLLAELALENLGVASGYRRQ